jgi:lipid A 3-O-deacylase
MLRSHPDGCRRPDAISRFSRDVRKTGGAGHSSNAFSHPPTSTTPGFPPNDRPYAGWLNLSFSLANLNGVYLEQIHLGIGVTGEASLAEEIQGLSDELLGANEASGWDTQLPTEVTLLLAYNRQWQLGNRAYHNGYLSDWAPHAGFSVSNAISQVRGGGFWRIGRNLPDDFGPPRISAMPNGSAYFRPSADNGWYICFGANLSYIAHNLFLDGTLFRESPSVDSKPFVGEVFMGYVRYWEDVRFSYTIARRSSEFVNQREPQNFGAITLTWSLGK